MRKLGLTPKKSDIAYAREGRERYPRRARQTSPIFMMRLRRWVANRLMLAPLRAWRLGDSWRPEAKVACLYCKLQAQCLIHRKR